jgi:hypothetical protein
MLSSRPSRLVRLTALGALLATAASAPAASAATHRHARTVSAPRPETIAFDTTTVSSDQTARTTTGIFTMTGAVGNAGTVRASYRFADGRIQGTAILVGGRGVFTLSLRGASGATVAGGWRVCGGTGAYRHLHGRGGWLSGADLGAGVLTGRFAAAPPES